MYRYRHHRLTGNPLVCVLGAWAGSPFTALFYATRRREISRLQKLIGETTNRNKPGSGCSSTPVQVARYARPCPGEEEPKHGREASSLGEENHVGSSLTYHTHIPQCLIWAASPSPQWEL
ncbi:hypothetical protein F5X99DRAFT_405418 [Biscogniauxia marginata]|nr:hypothetical protein F5X99DRAFT_405418 [Biscogniauxia marginata]